MSNAGYTGVPVMGTDTSSRSARALPLVFALTLGALSWTVSDTPGPFRALLAFAAALLVWHAVLMIAARQRLLAIDFVARRQHYVQIFGQSCVLAYWGWHWPEVYTALPLIAAQIAFAYGFDILLAWSRRDRYTLGFGPVPVVLSINLFLWFKPDWFAWQFVIVAVGLAAKEWIRWDREGKYTHIFNPSSFPLAIASLILVATGSTGITWGPEIASTQFYPAQMYLLLFLVGLPGQFFFGVTLMTMSAVLTAYLFGLAYFAHTGIYFFYDSYIPISVFLGMHLLFTDPSTAPRSELGRVLFGVLYGASTIVLYQALGMAGMPSFYDKLLQVPILNLMVRGIDRLANAPALQWVNPARLWPARTGPARHLAFMGAWAAVFAGMSVVQGVGDHHPGQWLPFWRQACSEGRDYACPYLADMNLGFCRQGSPWACNEAGLLHLALARSGEDLRRQDPAGAADPFRRGCELGLGAACENLELLSEGTGSFQRVLPSMEDWPVVLRGSKGAVTERDPEALLTLACGQGWYEACGRDEIAVE